MARASTPTLLSLDRYAAILGVVPPHFNSGVSAYIFPYTASCSQVWWQYAWQAVDRVSREDLALEIANAEREIAEQLRWWPAPVWIAQDVHMFPRFHRPEYWQQGSLNVRGTNKDVRAQYGKVIEPGQRAVDLLPNPVLVFDTFDGIDAFDETATVTVATTLTNECEIKVYFAGHNGDPEWEIRPARTKAIALGTFTATFWAWQLIDPAFWEAFPTETDVEAVNLDDAVYVNAVEVYREYNDPTATSAVFYWEAGPTTAGTLCAYCGGTGCTACQLTTQTGCLHIRDAERGLLVPVPATYDESAGSWAREAWTVCRDPDQLKMYYLCGDLSWLNLAGRRCEPLSDFWAQTIAALATARLERPLCACGNSTALANHWRQDLALSGGSIDDGRRAVSFAMLDNPFGTRRGEVMAWQRVRHHAERRTGATAI